MAQYSVAEAKDGLSGLIAKAEAGEEVIITRRGKPAVELRALPAAKRDHKSMQQWLKQRREARPMVDISSAEILRMEKEDYRY